MSECSECRATLTRRQEQRGGVVCSRRCSGRRLQRTLSESDKKQYRLSKANAGYRHAAYKRIVQEIISDIKPHVVGGMVSAEVAVKVAVKARRIGYDRGYGTAYNRGRRAPDAA